jgi:hypothetical protein
MTVKSESPNPVESPALAPAQIHSKVGAAAVAGALSVLVVYGASLAGVDIPSEPAVALGTILSFLAGYLAKS